MHSYEDRIRAVEPNTGTMERKPSVVVMELEYPSTKQLGFIGSDL